MTINERFEAIITELYNGNKRAFAKAANISPTVVENVVGSRKGNPSFEVMNKICANANISEKWLLTGEGPMLKEEIEGEHLNLPMATLPKGTYREDGVNTRPHLPYVAAAGSLSEGMEGGFLYQCERLPLIPTLPEYNYTMTASGDSMNPDIQSGDILACRKITDRRLIQWGRAHVIDTAQGIMVKRLYNGHGRIICHSTNPTYHDFDIEHDEIYHISLVVGLIRKL